MTPEQALSLLFQAARLAPLSWPDHDKILESTKLLQETLTSLNPTPTWELSKSE